MAELPELGLPPLFRRSLDYLAALTNEDFARFLDVVNMTPSTLPSEAVIERFESVLPEHDGVSVTGLVQFLLSTRGLTTTFDAEPLTIAAAVVRAAEPDSSEVVESRVLALLSSDFVALREKSLDLASEAGVVLRDARAITDLRPVFADAKATDVVAGFLVVHTLKLDVTGRQEPLFLSLDHDSIEKLMRILKRALEKEARLERLLAESKIADLSVRGER